MEPQVQWLIVAEFAEFDRQTAKLNIRGAFDFLTVYKVPSVAHAPLYFISYWIGGPRGQRIEKAYTLRFRPVDGDYLQTANPTLEFGATGTCMSNAGLANVEFREYGEYVAEILVGDEVQISQMIVVMPPPP